MVPTITTILQRLTGEWVARLRPEAILAACGEVGYSGWRDRVLTPVTTMPLFLHRLSRVTCGLSGERNQFRTTMSEPDGHLQPKSLAQVSEPVLHALLPHTAGCGVAHDHELRPCLHRLLWLHGKGASPERAIESPASMPLLLAV